MKKLTSLLSIALLVLISACKKSDTSTNASFWKVKYEVSCTNPNTQVDLTFRNESGGVTQIGDPTNPAGTYKKVTWTYEANYSKDPGLSAARGLTLIVTNAIQFNATDVITAKIYVDGNLVNQSNATGAFGIMVSYLLQ